MRPAKGTVTFFAPGSGFMAKTMASAGGTRLVVDVGNSRIKWGVCDATAVVKSASLPPDDAAAWHKQLTAWQLTGPLEWAVGGVHPQRQGRMVDWLHQRGDVVFLVSSPEQLPLKIAVPHPAKVGIDRLLNAVAVNSRRSARLAAFIVDAGSAVTVDYLDNGGVFRGGAILPGLRLMVKALHDYTALLPLIEVDANVLMPGSSTAEAMNAGIFCAVLGGIRELIDKVVKAESLAEGIEVFLGGGDAHLLTHKLPYTTTLWPEMTLEGLRLATAHCPLNSMTATYVACLTPAGTAAIATLALRGPEAWTWVRELALRSLPPEPEPGHFWLTRLGGAARGEADEVVVAVKQTVPEPWLELHCHGGREVVRFLEDLLAARGAEVRTWSDCKIENTDDALRAAALPVLAGALTVRTAAIALDQYQGAFAHALEGVRAALQGAAATDADRLLAELEARSPVGLHLTAPWRVVIAGAPNVGKSSLVNALAGYQRSVVSPQPGTTRDVVTTLLALDGWPVEVADTAGWRVADAAVEREGIARAGQAMASADLCLWLLDAAAAPTWPDANLGPVRYVINKIDLPPAWSFESVDALRVSAQTGAGLAELCQAIAHWLVPAIPAPGAGVPFTPGLVQGLAEIRSLTQAGNVLDALDKLEKLCRECN